MSIGFANVSLLQFALVAGVALFASIVGGVSGYGTGALVPLIGAAPFGPIIATSALLTNTDGAAACLKNVDCRSLPSLRIIGAMSASGT